MKDVKPRRREDAGSCRWSPRRAAFRSAIDPPREKEREDFRRRESVCRAEDSQIAFPIQAAMLQRRHSFGHVRSSHSRSTSNKRGRFNPFGHVPYCPIKLILTVTLMLHRRGNIAIL